MKPVYTLVCCLALLSAGPLRAQVRDTAAVTPAGVVVDFQDADLRLVISALAEAGGLNVIYGTLPARRITMRLTQPVPRESMLALLRSIAQSNGLALVEEGGIVRVEEVAAGAQPAAQAGAAGQAPPQERRLFVHRLQHAQAPRLAETLQALFGGGTSGGGRGLSRAPLSQALRQQQIPAAVPPGAAPDVTAVTLPGLTAGLQGDVQIVPDELTNSLLVRSTVADWEVIRQAIEVLDLRPLQVLIEGIIVEVRRSDDFQLSTAIRGTDRGRRAVDPGLFGELAGADSTGGLRLEIARLGTTDINVVLNALASRGNVRILSRPVITAQNNQEAKILIGEERPFVQVFRTLPTDAGVRDQIIQYRDVGTTLTVKPTINADGYVNLQIMQEVSTATSEQQFGAPVISTREASTLLYVRDGQTAVIGGLIDHQQERTRGGIPFLKDIPLLGALFGSTRRFDLNTELFLFLTPHVVASDEDVERARRGVQEGTRFLPDSLPRLPIPLSTGRQEPLIVVPDTAAPDTAAVRPDSPPANRQDPA